jgi:hypothetical protein
MKVIVTAATAVLMKNQLKSRKTENNVGSGCHGTESRGVKSSVMLLIVTQCHTDGHDPADVTSCYKLADCCLLFHRRRLPQ